MLDSGCIHIRLCHDIRIDIYEQHTECDRNKKQRLKTVFNCQIQEDTRYCDHDVVAYRQIHERRLIQ